ncbi:antA/AntB antirepressor family protein [Polaromonas hydrogenivorans]|uniref:AntA/AntB antirepressor family protein n=1 Tax=Polaromonas hydrogenivorans TaxID=335476 RepID=A0AAU7LWB9_9BURK
MADFVTGTSALIPVFTGTLSNSTARLCDARTLHAFMQVKRDFATWVKGRIRKFGFEEGTDYLLTKSGEQLPSGTKYSIDYHLTLDMAKELSMVENNDMGRQARRYFIACEKSAITPAIDRTAHAVPAINPAALLLSGQSDPSATLPPELQKAIDLRAWTLAHEAYGLVREHLARRVAFQAVSGVPRRVDMARATQVISEGDLGTALARTWHDEMRMLTRTAEMSLQISLQALERIRAASAQGGAA